MPKDKALDAIKKLVASSKDLKLSFNGSTFTLTGTNTDDYKAVRSLVRDNKSKEKASDGGK